MEQQREQLAQARSELAGLHTARDALHVQLESGQALIKPAEERYTALREEYKSQNAATLTTEKDSRSVILVAQRYSHGLIGMANTLRKSLRALCDPLGSLSALATAQNDALQVLRSSVLDVGSPADPTETTSPTNRRRCNNPP